MEPKKTKVFLSYCHEDNNREYITNFKKKLITEVKHKTGFIDLDVFQDKTKLKEGDVWRKRIIEELDNTSFFVLILTPSYINSEICLFEIEYYLKIWKNEPKIRNIIPIYFTDISDDILEKHEEKTKLILGEIKTIHYADWKEINHRNTETLIYKEKIGNTAKMIIDVFLENIKHTKDFINLKIEDVSQIEIYPQDYDGQKKAVLEIFQAYTKIRENNNDGVDISILEKKVQKLKDNKYLLAVVGQAKSGKSKFINALLGKEIMPTDVKQCTCGIIEIIDSKEIYLKVIYANEQIEYNEYKNVDELCNRLRTVAAIQEKYRQIPIIPINEFLIQNKSRKIFRITNKFIQIQKWENTYNISTYNFKNIIKEYINENQDLEKIPKEINVGYPLGDEFSQMRIVDTPGVGARGGFENVTLNYISQADAAILIHTYKNVGNSSLYQFYKNDIPEYIKEKLFLFLTHKVQIPKEIDQVETIKEAKGLFSEVKDQIELIDSMLKLIYEELNDGKTIDEICKDEDKFHLLAKYRLRYNDDIEIIKNKLLFDSNYSNIEKRIKDFSNKARYQQLKDIINDVKYGLEQQKKDYEEYIKLHKNKIDKTPEEFNKEITLLKKNLEEYQKTLVEFLSDIIKRYKGNKGLFSEKVKKIQAKYSSLINKATEDTIVLKHIADFNFDCDTNISSIFEKLNIEYKKEMDRIGVEYMPEQGINFPKLNCNDISSKAKSNSYDKIKIEETSTNTTIGGGLGGLFLGFCIGGPVGALIGGLGGAIMGNVIGETKYKEEFNSSKYLNNLKAESDKLIIQTTENICNTLDSSLSKYDQIFKKKLNKMIVDKMDIYEKLRKEENIQVPMFRKIDSYNFKIASIDSISNTINGLLRNIK